MTTDDTTALDALYETDSAELDADAEDATTQEAVAAAEQAGKTEMVGNLSRTEYEAIIAAAAVW